MITRGIHRYCLQDTWLLGTFSRKIRGHLLLHHGMATKPCHRGWVSTGVAIILGPALLRAWDIVGKLPPITSAYNSDFTDRMIGVNLCLYNPSNKKADTYHKRGIGRIDIFLASIYHPVEHDDQNRINEELAIFYNAIPQKTNFYPARTSNLTSASGPRCFAM